MSEHRNYRLQVILAAIDIDADADAILVLMRRIVQRKMVEDDVKALHTYAHALRRRADNLVAAVAVLENQPTERD